ncbi:hypothetical protein BsIDN1_01050 [Bacillus safensis]|uniref:50S ribosomal protein L25 n=1 Tax=Bacillus safensis TaxID=561879 RepID=A0A5S9LYJ9_BACIA|nr:hypothetical protein BsIDN1_01050 [Bacillus safensis]
MGGETKSVMVTELQTDPLKNELVHADFQVVDLQREIEADVPIQLIGESKGVKKMAVCFSSHYLNYLLQRNQKIFRRILKLILQT